MATGDLGLQWRCECTAQSTLGERVQQLIWAGASAAVSGYEFCARVMTPSERPPSFILLEVTPAQGAASGSECCENMMKGVLNCGTFWSRFSSHLNFIRTQASLPDALCTPRCPARSHYP